MAKSEIYMVIASFIGSLNGVEVEYHEGEIVDADDPALAKWPRHFGPVAFPHRKATPVVEQATAAPGQKRGA